MQQSPRFAPFGPWKSSSTSANHFPRFLSGLLAFPERHFPEAHSPYGPWAIPPLSTEGPLGKHATSFSNVMKPNASTDASLHPKWSECWYRPFNKVAPQIGLGGILQNLKGNYPDWSAKFSPIEPSIPLPKTGESPRFPRSDYEEPTPEQVEAFKASGSRLARILYSDPDRSKAPLPTTPHVVEEHTPSTIPKGDKPDDNELKITIGGSTGYLSWEHIAQTSGFYSFFQRCNRPASNSLSVEWHDSDVDQFGTRGRIALKLLFRYLNKSLPVQSHDVEPVLCPLSTVAKLSIKVPEVVKDLQSIDDLGQICKEDDNIDLKNAHHVRQFSWCGDFSVFAMKVSNAPLASLSVLSLKGCLISINDAVAIAHSAPALEALTFESVVPPGTTDFGDLLKPSSKDIVEFPHMTSLKLTCPDGHKDLLGRLGLNALRNLTLQLEDDRVYDVTDFSCPTVPWSYLESLELVGAIDQDAHSALLQICQCSIQCLVK